MSQALQKIDPPRLRALTMLNEQGDTTIVWTEDQDDAMEAIIEKRMKEGCCFFIIEPRFGTRSPLKKFSQARQHRMLAIPDMDFAKFVGEGKIESTKTPEKPATVKRKARSAKEAATSETIGVAPRRGG